jgi:replicative DNA helicase
MSAAEQAVLGAVMLDASAYWQVADIVTADDFGDERNARVYTHLAGLIEAAKPVDVFMIGESLPDLSHYVLEVANASASASTARAYADVVRQDSERRKVVAAGRRMALERPTFAEAQAILADVAPRNANAIKSAGELLGSVMDSMQRRLEQDGSITGQSTGLANFDKRTSGLQPGCLYIIAGRPSMGKTAAGLQIAVNVAMQGKRAFVAELEMTGEGLTERALSYLSGVDYGLIRHPKMLREEHWPRITDATAKVNASGLIIDDTPGQTGEQIIAKARQLHMQSPLSLLVVDHLGLVRLPGRGRPDLETSAITKSLKALAKKLSIPVLCLVQLNRKVEERQDKRPLLSDLRESGGIEEDADVVVMLYRDEYYHAESQHKGYAEWLIRKNRDGETGMDPYRAVLNQMHFVDAEELPYVPEPEPRRPHGRFGRSTGFQARGREEA